MDKDFKRLEKTEVYKGFRLHVFNEKIQLPDGKTAVWENAEHIGASAVVPVDEDGKILLVRQYRLAADQKVLEIPAGVLDYADEDPMECAKRELEEETGYASGDVEYMCKFLPAIGYSDEVINIYYAKNLKKTAQNLDEGEFVTIERYTIEELLEMIKSGEILDGKTISALLYYNQFTKEQ